MARRKSSTKVCRMCGESKPREQFAKWARDCTACVDAPDKVCQSCGIRQPKDAFQQYRQTCRACKSAYDLGYYATNKPHINARNTAYYHDNKEHLTACNRAYVLAHYEDVQAYQQAYRDENKERLAAYFRAYYEAHQDEKRAYASAYGQAHADKVLARVIAWGLAHPERVRYHRVMKDFRRRTRLAQDPRNDLTPEQHQAVIDAAHGRCPYCPVYNPTCALCPKGQHTDLTIDHITAVAKGGPNTLHNLIACCGTCNTKKMTRHAPVLVQPLLL